MSDFKSDLCSVFDKLLKGHCQKKFCIFFWKFIQKKKFGVFFVFLSFFLGFNSPLKFLNTFLLALNTFLPALNTFFCNYHIFVRKNVFGASKNVFGASKKVFGARKNVVIQWASKNVLGAKKKCSAQKRAKMCSNKYF